MEKYKGKHYKTRKVNIVEKIKRKAFYLHTKYVHKVVCIINKHDEFMDNLELKIEQFINKLAIKVRGQVLKVDKKMKSWERNVCGVNTAQDKCKGSTWSEIAVEDLCAVL